MLSQELLKKIRHIEIHTRRLLSGTHIGDYSTAQKGSGLEFDQLREYQPGDDIRFIDWNSTVRTNKLLVRQYLEERNRTVILMVDVSPSTQFGSTETLKSELMAQVASALALVADYGKDAVGLMQYADTVVRYIPPERGRKHVHRIMQHLFEDAASLHDVSQDMQTRTYRDSIQLLRTKHKNAIVFVISDFIDTASSIDALGRVGRKSEIIAVRCLDKLERSFPRVGMLAVQNHKATQPSRIDVHSYRTNAILQERLAQQNALFKKYKIDVLDLSPGKPFMHDLIAFSKRRMMY